APRPSRPSPGRRPTRSPNSSRRSKRSPRHWPEPILQSQNDKRPEPLARAFSYDIGIVGLRRAIVSCLYRGGDGFLSEPANREVFGEGFAEAVGFGDDEVAWHREASRGEAQSAGEVFGGGGDNQFTLLIEADRHDPE